MWGLPHVRSILFNVGRSPWWMLFSRKRHREIRLCYTITEFLHNLYVSILDEKFVFHDIWFLNVQAKSFYNHASSEPWLQSPHVFKLISELFSLVPPDKKHELKWPGPRT